jgi:hypothetical protein
MVIKKRNTNLSWVSNDRSGNLFSYVIAVDMKILQFVAMRMMAGVMRSFGRDDVKSIGIYPFLDTSNIII